MKPQASLRAQVESEIRAGRYCRARQLCEKALVECRGDDDFFPLTLARLAFVENRRREALRRLAALRREVCDDATWVRMGELYEELGQRRAALRSYERAVRVDRSPRPLHRLIELLRAEGRDAEADRWRDDVLLVDWPHDPRGLEDRAAALFGQAQHDRAFAIYAGLSDAFDAYACAEILLRYGRDAEALRYCQVAAERGAHLPWAHYRAAQILERRGDPVAALQWLDRAPVRGHELTEFRVHLLLQAGQAAEAQRQRTDMLGPLAQHVRERLALMRAGRCVLHGYRDRHGWRRLHVRPLLYLQGDVDVLACRAFAEAALAELERFHQGEFGPHPGFTVAILEERRGRHSYGWFRNAVEHRAFRVVSRGLDIRQRRRHEVVLVLWCGDAGGRGGALAEGLPDGARDGPSSFSFPEAEGLLPRGRGGLSEGYGGYGYAVLRCVPSDPYGAAVLTHEFYHAALGLQHTDGEKDVTDAAGLMGDPGGKNHLHETYVHPRQRAMCATVPEALRLVRRGVRHEERREWDEAASCYRRAVSLDPLYLWPAAQLSRVEVHRGDYREAELLLRRLLEIDDALDHASHLAHVLLDQGRVGEARRVIASMHRKGMSERASLLEGFAWGMSWYHPPALAAFRRALGLSPGSLAARAGIAAILFATGRSGAARREYETILEADPNWAEACDRLAVVHAADGDLAVAWSWVRRAARLKRAGGLHHWARARVFGYAGQWEEALASTRRSLAEEPHGMAALLFEPWILVLLGRIDEAREAFVRCRNSERLSPYGRVAGAWVDILDPGATLPLLERQRRTLMRLSRRGPRLGSLAHARLLLEENPELAPFLHRVEPRLPATAALGRMKLLESTRQG